MARANIAIAFFLALALVAASSIDAARVVPAAESEVIPAALAGRSLLQGVAGTWTDGKYNPGPPTAASKAPATKAPLKCTYGPVSKLGQNKVCT